MPEILIRAAVSSDCSPLAELCFALWPESPLEEHARELAERLSGRIPGTLPLSYFVAETPARQIVGFIETGLRSHADCCDPTHPVGFIEGWYVKPEFRRNGLGRRLVAAAEDWARAHGCREMASDTGVDNAASQRCHEALGYEAVSRAVNYRKPL
jgi:aminoglycoside 6'-N-acetyltransferase I